MEFNHADLFEGLAETIGDRVAVICEDRRSTYAELDVEANRLAHHLLSRGIGPGAHVGIQLRNGVEYIAGILAALKIRAVPININYRYVEAELRYLYTDADLVALLYDAEFEERVSRITTPTLRHRVVVGGRSATATPYAEALAGSPGTRGFPRRSGRDLYVIYTGGTTGLPKGAMWQTEDLFMAFGGGNPYGPPRATPQEVIDEAVKASPAVMLAVPPLMHGAAQMATFTAWWRGSTMVYVRRFDPARVWRAVERERVMTMNLVGDAMARPLTEALAGESYDLSSLLVISSAGAILSGAVRDRLQEALPKVLILDSFGSTESGYTASAVAGATPESGLTFQPNATARLKVVTDGLEPAKPGELGMVAKTGHIAFGYYNDPEKSAETFVTDGDGTRWLLTGDLATVREDGTITVFGRGSQCVNTGGEKVFPEEVEAVLKGHAAVFDAVVTGIPDETWGNRVVAVVEARPGVEVTVAELDAHCRARLSGYKVPRLYAFVPEIHRSPAGKADYRWARKVATDSLR